MVADWSLVPAQALRNPDSRAQVGHSPIPHVAAVSSVTSSAGFNANRMPPRFSQQTRSKTANSRSFCNETIMKTWLECYDAYVRAFRRELSTLVIEPTDTCRSGVLSFN